MGGARCAVSSPLRTTILESTEAPDRRRTGSRQLPTPPALSAPPPAIGMRRRRDVGAADSRPRLLVVLGSGCASRERCRHGHLSLIGWPIKRAASGTKVPLPCSRSSGTRTGLPSGSTRTAASFPARTDGLELSVPGRRHGSTEMIVGLSGAHGRSRLIAGRDSRGPDRRSRVLWNGEWTGCGPAAIRPSRRRPPFSSDTECPAEHSFARVASWLMHCLWHSDRPWALGGGDVRSAGSGAPRGRSREAPASAYLTGR